MNRFRKIDFDSWEVRYKIFTRLGVTLAIILALVVAVILGESIARTLLVIGACAITWYVLKKGFEWVDRGH
ncbi:MAG: hypothetical protein ACWGQW_08520 [bacterium]